MPKPFFHQSLLSSIGLPPGTYTLFYRHGIPLLVFPANRATALETLRLYAAQTLPARIAYIALTFLIHTGLHRVLLPRIRFSSPATPPLYGLQPSCSIGLLLCNPEHGHARCVGVLRNKNTTSILKIADPQGASILQQESQQLTLPPSFGLPRLLSFETLPSGIAALHMEHIHGHSIRAIDTPDVLTLLHQWLSPESIPAATSPYLRGIPLTSLSTQDRARLETLPIRRAFTHGDFHPWNLITTPNGLRAIDFEWASPNGLAGLDLAEGLAPISQTTLSPEAKRYLEESGWSNDLPLLERLTLCIRNYRLGVTP